MVGLRAFAPVFYPVGQTPWVDCCLPLVERQTQSEMFIHHPRPSGRPPKAIEKKNDAACLTELHRAAKEPQMRSALRSPLQHRIAHYVQYSTIVLYDDEEWLSTRLPDSMRCSCTTASHRPTPCPYPGPFPASAGQNSQGKGWPTPTLVLPAAATHNMLACVARPPPLVPPPLRCSA